MPATYEVTPDLACVPTMISNLYLVGRPAKHGGDASQWVLVDTGIPGSAGRIRRAAERRFGEGARPQAIILTHGHFDHVGAVRKLADEWDVPVYAHELEMPYLTGRSAYPPADPTVGGGLFAWMSPVFPRGPIDIRDRVQPLPADGSVPGMPGWRWIHTPGHAPGHVSLFRDLDGTLIAGDAFVTTKQESLLAALAKTGHVHRPPAYFTIDWEQARDSVRRLAALEPDLAATGHGLPMRGSELRYELSELARHFDEAAVPKDGRYVRQPALADRHGIVATPPPVGGTGKLIATLGLTALAVGVAYYLLSQERERRAVVEPEPRHHLEQEHANPPISVAPHATAPA